MKISGDVHQGLLLKHLRTLFPDVHTFVNTKKHANIKFASGKLMEFDIWIPELHVCFEFQDLYHYTTTWYYQRSQLHVTRRDNEKKKMARQHAMNLIVVPCWWDGTAGSLAATIHFVRPDLLSNPTGFFPIALDPPIKFFKTVELPGVGELMLASFPTDAKSDIPIHSNWWMGEKYDGIRLCWNPQNSTAYTRFGKPLELLPKIYTLLPKKGNPSYKKGNFLDGEIWFGRGQYSYAYMLLAGSEGDYWQYFRFLVFDEPSYGMQKKPFEERYNALLDCLSPDNPIVTIAARVLCQNHAHLDKISQSIIEDEGEGVVIRKIGSLYEHGRNLSLIKMKTSLCDKEALVIATSTSSVCLKLPSGITFDVEASDVHVPALKLGDVVTFSYEVASRREVPTNPVVYRIRTDVSWEDVVRNAAAEQHFLSESSHARFKASAPGHWTPKNMRAFMEKFAKSRNLDPLRAKTWYSSREAFSKSKGGKTILGKFKGGYYHALRNIFPEIKFKYSAFQRSSWQSVENRRKFFEKYAKEKGFDSQNPSDWYMQSRESILAVKGASAIVSYHNRNLVQTLMDLFPNIGLEKSKFDMKSIWSHQKNRRRFFELYAKKHGFDPLHVANWYNVTRQDIAAIKGGKDILYFYHNSISRTLDELFPEIGIDRSRWHAKSAYREAAVRREFFESYARDNGFEPLSPANWYSQFRDDIMAKKGAYGVMSFYDGSVTKALLDLFPAIGLDESLLQAQRSVWKFPENRRKFFETYAKKKGFDPLDPEPWYTQSREDILAAGGRGVILHHNFSVNAALLDLFPDVQFNRSKMPFNTLWSMPKNRRKFFEQYAEENQFDPLVPENWYSRSLQSIMAKQGAPAVIAYHSRSVTKALLDLFPDINLEKPKLLVAKSLWHESSSRRNFFETYAREHAFDPLVPDNWYSSNLPSLVNEKGARGMLVYHNGSVTKALLELFPEIGFDRTSLQAAFAANLQK